MDERRSERSKTEERPVDSNRAGPEDHGRRAEVRTAVDGQKNSDDIERDIAQTRREMDETVDEIQQRMRPKRLRQEAGHVVQDTVRKSAQGAGNRMLDTVKKNPVPAIIAGLSIGWLVKKSSGSPKKSSHSSSRHRSGGDHSTQQTAEQYGHKAQETAKQYSHQAEETTKQYSHQAEEKARQYGHQAQHRAQRTVGRMERMMEENPLAVGAATLALGAFSGLMLPGTRKEDEFMGKTRDRMMQKAQSTAQETAARAGHVVEETAKKAKETAKKETQQEKKEMQQEKKQSQDQKTTSK